LNEDIYTYEYLPHRGLNKRTLEFYDIKSKIDAQGKPVADGFVWPDGCTMVRSLASKDMYWRKPEGKTDVQAGLFGRDKFNAGGSDSIIITEGAYDAASAFQVLHIPAVSVRSSASAGADCAMDRSFLDSHKKIYLGYDADGPGRAARAATARLFDPNKLYVLDWDRRKDANDYLQNNEADELRNIFANAKKYLPETVVNIDIEAATKILSDRPSIGVPYPLAKLNAMTYGIRKGESVLITAPPGVGKTELMHAIEYQLLQETDSNVGSIFLEEPKADHLRALASTHLQRPAFVPEHGVSDDAVAAAALAACKNSSRLYLYSHFGSSDPDVVLDTIRFLVAVCKTDYILLDHVNLVVSGIRGEDDERRALDYICTRLEMMVKELNFGLIFISHINDMGRTRGSRAMEQLCDVRLELSRDARAGSNIVDVTISKNRAPMGKTGSAGSYVFDTFTRRYLEVANDNHPADSDEAASRKAA
jgi:DnaB-like helicase C terminal domain/Toprim-like